MASAGILSVKAALGKDYPLQTKREIFAYMLYENAIEED